MARKGNMSPLENLEDRNPERAKNSPDGNHSENLTLLKKRVCLPGTDTQRSISLIVCLKVGVVDSQPHLFWTNDHKRPMNVT